jgi:hypothetical protein
LAVSLLTIFSLFYWYVPHSPITSPNHPRGFFTLEVLYLFNIINRLLFLTIAHPFIMKIYNYLSYIYIFFKSQDKFGKYYLKLWGYDMDGIYDLQEGLLKDFTNSFFIP